jgi:hypothetical protein
MSPALLSKRLKDLEAAGIVSRSQLAGDPACIPRPARHAGTLPARRLQNHILPNKSGEAGPLGQSDSPIYCRVSSDSRLCLVQLIQQSDWVRPRG